MGGSTSSGDTAATTATTFAGAVAPSPATGVSAASRCQFSILQWHTTSLILIAGNPTDGPPYEGKHKKESLRKKTQERKLKKESMRKSRAISTAAFPIYENANAKCESATLLTTPSPTATPDSEVAVPKS